MRIIGCFTLVLLSVLLYGCKKDCEGEADLIIPEYISETVLVKQEYGATWIGNSFYPYGTDVFLANAYNEFYSVQRYDPWTGYPVKIYWSLSTYYPFSSWDTGVLHPLLEGEQVSVHRCIYNQTPPTFSCLFSTAAESHTEVDVIVQVVNGEVVDQQHMERNTPSVPPGQYRVIDFPVTVSNGNLEYSFNLTANFDHLIPESDYTNNDYVSRPEDDLGG